MKYAFINRNRRVWPISVQCRVLEASVAGYHEHFVRRDSAAQLRHPSDDALLVHIKVVHAETRGANLGWLEATVRPFLDVDAGREAPAPTLLLGHAYAVDLPGLKFAGPTTYPQIWAISDVHS